jgi:hypothetical protein
MPKLKEVTPRVRMGRGVARHNLTIFPLYADEELKPANYVPVGNCNSRRAGESH